MYSNYFFLIFLFKFYFSISESFQESFELKERMSFHSSLLDKCKLINNFLLVFLFLFICFNLVYGLGYKIFGFFFKFNCSFLTLQEFFIAMSDFYFLLVLFSFFLIHLTLGYLFENTYSFDLLSNFKVLFYTSVLIILVYLISLFSCFNVNLFYSINNLLYYYFSFFIVFHFISVFHVFYHYGFNKTSKVFKFLIAYVLIHFFILSLYLFFYIPTFILVSHDILIFLNPFLLTMDFNFNLIVQFLLQFQSIFFEGLDVLTFHLIFYVFSYYFYTGFSFFFVIS